MLPNANLRRILVISFHKYHCLLFAVVLFLLIPPAFGFEKKSSAIGAWNLKCKAKTDVSNEQCIANQLITTGKSEKQVLLGVMIGYSPEHSLPHIIFRMSPKANRAKGAAVKVDKFESFGTVTHTHLTLQTNRGVYN